MTYLERMCRALDGAGVHYALVGGYAVALHGAPRGTIDIDDLIEMKRGSGRAQDLEDAAALEKLR